MKQKFYIYNDNAPEGPFSVDELKGREITKYTPIWHEGLLDWTPAGKIDALETLWSYQPDSPFVHYPDAPPPFSQDGYEKKLTADRFPAAAPFYRNALVWVAVVGLVLIVAGWFAYNRSTQRANDLALAAVMEDEKRWDDSVTKRAREEQTAAMMNNTADAAAAAEAVEAKEFYESRQLNAQNYARLNIERLVRATKSYDRKRFGGIENARVTFFNNSDFPIARAEFKVQYVKANGEVFETESMVIENIEPHRSKSKPAPESKRGMEMRATLTKIVAPELSMVKNVNIGF